jgi:hypothetical protein
LNLLSFSALVFLAWYGHRGVPVLPRWVVYGLALTLPWTLFYSTHVVNPSYVLFGAVLFWVGVVEATVGARQSRDSHADPADEGRHENQGEDWPPRPLVQF